ncbi:MAG: hypothetical protein QOI99_775 [Actinomycetota bacterium]|nr:hypothetical protein [Actinomycetota bacterium]
MKQSQIAEVLSHPLSKELLARPLMRMGYVAKDGTPRCIPTGFFWNGEQLVMCTAKNAPKLGHLKINPAVSLTIDTDEHPPKILLIRGGAELDYVDHIPDEFIGMNKADHMTPEQRVEWEAGVRGLYVDGMVRIVITPTWAKLIDFETTLPQAVAELVQRQADRRTRL